MPYPWLQILTSSPRDYKQLPHIQPQTTLTCSIERKSLHSVFHFYDCHNSETPQYSGHSEFSLNGQKTFLVHSFSVMNLTVSNP